MLYVVHVGAVRLAISVTRMLWSDSATGAIQEFHLAVEDADIVDRIRQRILARHYFLSE